MKRCRIRALVLAAMAISLVAPALPAMRIPANVAIAGGLDDTSRSWAVADGFRRVYDPSVGENEPWYINDHTFIKSHTGEWHMFGITHPEPADPENEILFAHATAPTMQGPWIKHPPALVVDRDYGETHLWAPHVIRVNGIYYMFYNGGGPNPAEHQINVATSTDLFHWIRHPGGPLFRDGLAARDPMVTRVGAQWVMYYTATSSPIGGNHVVAYRTSTDLIQWSERRIAYTDPVAGAHGGPTESPYVIQHDGWWYLFVCCRIDYVSTQVYRSRDPFHFDVNNRAGYIAAHAAEVIPDNGTWWISAAGWGQGGVHLAPLSWQTLPSGGNLYALSPNKDAVYRWTGEGSTWTRIGGPAGLLYGGGAGLFATNPTTGDLYRYLGTPDQWERVGGPGHTFAVTSTRLFGLAVNGASVHQWIGPGDNWITIGGPAGNLYGGGAGLFATNPTTGDLYRYLGTPDHWERVGGPGRTFNLTPTGVYGLAPDGSGVYQWTGIADRWSRIGGPAGTIYGANEVLLVTDPHTGDIYRYLGAPEHWMRVGGPGHSFTVNDAGPFGLAVDRSAVFKWIGPGDRWTMIGGPANTVVAAA